MTILHNKIPPPIIALMVGSLMWYLSKHIPLLTFHFFAQEYLAYILMVIGISLDIISFFNFRKNKTTVNPIRPDKTKKLVVTGFYTFTRNPMYLGMFLILFGTGLIFSSISGLFALPLFIVLINELQIKPEEKMLEKLFGERFIEYKTKVRRWI